VAGILFGQIGPIHAQAPCLPDHGALRSPASQVETAFVRAASDKGVELDPVAVWGAYQSAAAEVVEVGGGEPSDSKRFS
jgi:hypothetical protein